MKTTDKIIRIGIIGFGYWGPNYVRVLNSFSNISLKWICDLDEALIAKAKMIAPQIQITKNYYDILSDPEIDAVIIVTPAKTHYQIAVEALKYGKHILVEKPLANSASGVKRLYKYAEKKKKVVMAGHTYLFHPSIQYIRKYILKNNMGKIFHFIAQRTNLGPIRSDTNALWDLATHDISLILYLLNIDPVFVTATGMSFLQRNIEDVVQINVQFENKIIANILVSWLAPIKTRELTIIGENKMIVFNDVVPDEKVKIINKRVIGSTKGELLSFSTFQKLSLFHGETVFPNIPQKEPLREQAAFFINNIYHRNKMDSLQKNVVDTTRILEAAERSLKMHKTIKLN